MNFRTEVRPLASNAKIQLGQRILSIGSCFAETMAEKLHKYKFSVLANPFGTIYDPLSINRLISLSLDKESLNKTHFTETKGVHGHLDVHTQLDGLTKIEVENNINQAKQTTSKSLRNADWLIITLGTAWVYEYLESNKYICNCHKLPSSKFSKTLLSLDETTKAINNIIGQVTSVNKNIQILITISPVRHVKDTIEGNQVSKSILRLATHNMVEKRQNVSYFPAYEIMMDDLRDYRFYGRDLIHPTDVAEDYIWEKFIDAYMDEKTKTFISKWGKIISAMNHRPFHSQSIEHQNFLKSVKQQLINLSDLTNIEAELALIDQQILP